jgi:hypothetical protein
LNWYIGKDTMDIKVYKDTSLVYENSIDDDGIIDNSKKVLLPQKIEIKNSGTHSPENGVYKIVISASSDTVIKKISTNLQKIVFANSIFPISNSNVYPSIVSSTSATTVYTNALALSATTNHMEGYQNILVGDNILGISTINKSAYLPPENNITKIVIPKNDVVINGIMGYFAFSEDQFFFPNKNYILPISKKEDINLVDYILTDYKAPKVNEEWKVNEYNYNLSSANIKDGKLSWIIKAPKLKESNNNIIIKDIQVTLHKSPWI